MTAVDILLIPLGLILFVFYRWAFINLPGERGQFVATIPLTRNPEGGWRGLNVTGYGAFASTACALAVLLTFVLLGAVGANRLPILITVSLLLAICAPASALVAQWVEGKKYAFSVGGASFVGLLCAPAVLVLQERLLPESWTLPFMPALATLGTVYLFGEGFGRLACISFGCCFGKPLAESPRWIRALFRGRAFRFSGQCKKAAFAAGLEGVPLVPIQAVTASLNVAAGLVCLALYFRGHFALVFVASTVFAQAWRIYSETLRADYRGDNKISAYQWMAAIGSVLACLIAWCGPAIEYTSPNLSLGLAALDHPMMVLFLQALWLTMLVYLGFSTQTASRVEMFVLKERI